MSRDRPEPNVSQGQDSSVQEVEYNASTYNTIDNNADIPSYTYDQ